MPRPALNQLNHLNPISTPDRLILLAVAALPASFQHSKIIAHTDAWEHVCSVTLKGTNHAFVISQQNQWLDGKRQALLIFYLGVLIERQERSRACGV